MRILISEPLENLINQTGERLTSIYMPTHAKGMETQQNPIRFKNLLAEAERKLLELGASNREAEAALRHGTALLGDRVFWENQRAGLAVFLTADGIQTFQSAQKFDNYIYIGDKFSIRPLLPHFAESDDFYVLALSLGMVDLFKASQYEIRKVELEDMPNSLAEALDFDQFEKHQTQSGRRVNMGGPGITRGAVEDSRTRKKNILQFFQALDNALSDYFKGAQLPMVVAAVDYLLPIFREASHYPRLAQEHIVGNPETLSPQELRQQAWEILEITRKNELQKVLDRYLHGKGGSQVSNQLAEIVSAAHFGRVDTLFCAMNNQHEWGEFDVDNNRVHFHKTRGPESFDLREIACVATLLNSGEVHILPEEDMPDEAACAAILRY
ncbi:MAG: hypothetical protein JW750_00365 [Anaerolineaceae bacterium]|nr:hypothetical protein [Anaerolineaceae bacterium]